MIVAYDVDRNLPVTLIPSGTKLKGNLWMHDGYSYYQNVQKNDKKYLFCRMRGVRGKTKCQASAWLTADGRFKCGTFPHTCH